MNRYSVWHGNMTPLLDGKYVRYDDLEPLFYRIRQWEDALGYLVGSEHERALKDIIKEFNRIIICH